MPHTTPDFWHIYCCATSWTYCICIHSLPWIPRDAQNRDAIAEGCSYQFFLEAGAGMDTSDQLLSHIRYRIANLRWQLAMLEPDEPNHALVADALLRAYHDCFELMLLRRQQYSSMRPARLHTAVAQDADHWQHERAVGTGGTIMEVEHRFRIGDRVRLISQCPGGNINDQGIVQSVHQGESGQIEALTVLIDSNPPNIHGTTVLIHEIELVLPALRTDA